jgi:hypothetical protein
VAASGNKAYGPDRPVRGVGRSNDMNQNHTTKPRKKQKVKEETRSRGVDDPDRQLSVLRGYL